MRRLARSPAQGLPEQLKKSGEDGSTIVTQELHIWPAILGVGDGKYVTLLDARQDFHPGPIFRRTGQARNSSHDRSSRLPLLMIPRKPLSRPVLEPSRTSQRGLDEPGIEMKYFFDSKVDELGGQINLTPLIPLALDVGSAHSGELGTRWRAARLRSGLSDARRSWFQ